jgi:hypothetical protein
MKKRLLVMAVLAAGGALLLFAQGGFQDFSKYEALKEPQIRQMPAQRMLVVEAKGDPNVVGQNAFGLLFKTFFSLPGARMAAPRARWLNSVNSPKNVWRGLYGLPLPDSVKSLPQGITDARIETWEYGEVAEILHIGPYSEETPAIKKLIQFIDEKGCQIAGAHEEEYLKGPGMAASPAEYWTIIRYQVKKR